MLIQRRADDGRCEVVLYHETEEDRLWYRTFFVMCREFGVSWSKASEEQRAFIEKNTRINYEREKAKHDSKTYSWLL